MLRVILLFGCVAAAGAALWLSREPVPAREPLVEAPHADAPSEPAANRRTPLPARAAAPVRPAAALPTVAAAPPAQKLARGSEALRRRIDEQIPSRLYGEAARCYQGGLRRDQRVDVDYKLHVRDGEVTVSDVQLTDSTITDRALERCIESRVAAAHWRDDQVPDWESEDTLFLSVRGFKSHLQRDDDDGPGDGTEPGLASAER